MRSLTHPLSRARYEWADDNVGPVQVTDLQGREGRFDRDGRWVAGEIAWADPEMCRWIVSGGPTSPAALSDADPTTMF